MSWLARILGKKSAPTVKEQAKVSEPPTGNQIANAWLRDHIARTGNTERPEQADAWALILRSPWRNWGDATSWFGGKPRAPAGFDWPRGPDGAALHFLVQIDLAALAPHPTTGARPPGLPSAGALLVFASYEGHATRILTANEMAIADEVPLPEGLGSLKDIHHWRDEQTFTRWPLDPVPFLDDGADWPAAFPKPFVDPSQWITTWGMARLESEFLLKTLHWTENHQARSTAAPDPNGSHQAKLAHFYQVLAGAPVQEMLKIIRHWHETAASLPPDMPVDRQSLHGLFALRRRLSEGMGSYALTQALKGWPQKIWSDFVMDHRARLAAQDLAGIPPGLRDFVEANVTTWRGHRLFGLIDDLPFSEVDRRGHDLLLSVQGDDLIGNQREHTGGSSIWCRREDLIAGRHESGLLLHHDNG